VRRTLPALVFDDRKVEDCDTDGEDHAPDALRYGLMSRPAPKAMPKPNPPGDFEADAILSEVLDRRRRARYIGHEREYERMAGSNSDERYLRLLHPAQFRGPSDT
jgi:hypothetical protein